MCRCLVTTLLSPLSACSSCGSVGTDFNPGSQLTYAGAANAEATTYIALTTTLAAAAGAVVAMVCSWVLFSKPDLTMALNGVLGGLVAITANCDRVAQWEALLIGAIGGALVVAGVDFAGQAQD